MKNVIISLSIVAVIAGTMAFSGCAKVPEQELSVAKVMLDSARMEQAEVYAPELFSAAQDSLSAAVAEIEKQNKNTKVSRNFDAAEALLASSETLTKNARATTQAEKLNVKIEVDSIFERAAKMLEEAKSVLAVMSKGKGVQSVEADIAGVQTTLNDVLVLNTQGEFTAARDKANSALIKLAEVKTAIASSIAAKSGPANAKAEKKSAHKK